MLVVFVAGVLLNMDVVTGPNCGTLIAGVPNCGVVFAVTPNCGVLVVGTPNCGVVVTGVLNCGVAAVVGVPNLATVLLLIVPKMVVLLVVVASVDVTLATLLVPNTNRGLLTDGVRAADVPNENVGVLGNPNVGVVVVVMVVIALELNELLAVVTAELFDVKLKDLLVSNGNDIAWLLAAFTKVFVFCTLPSDWFDLNMLDDFGDCEAILLLPPKANNGICTGADVVVAVMLFNTLFAMLLKPAILVTFILTGNDVVPVN